MTEKEFEQLKVGDKVWYLTDLWSYTETKPYELLVVGKQNGCSYITTSWLDGTHVMNFSWLKSYLTKAEALEASIERCEARIKDKEDDIAYEKKELDRYKVELAKAKKEEEVVWTVDFDEGTVARSTKRRWEGSVENYEWSLGSPRYKPCETEQEAYEALANYYKGKYEEALSKACVVRYFVCGKRIITLHDCYEFLGGNFYGYDYDGQKHCSVHRGEDIFPTRQEAEAELERRKAK